MAEVNNEIIVNTNSYITREEATSYLSTQVGAEGWTTEEVHTQNTNIITSFREIENEVFDDIEEAKAAQYKELVNIYVHGKIYLQHKALRKAGAKRVKNSKSEVEYHNPKDEAHRPDSGMFGAKIIRCC